MSNKDGFAAYLRTSRDPLPALAKLEFKLRNNKRYRNSIHCFVEGHPDKGFYANFLVHFFSNTDTTLEFHVCGGKEHVLSLHAELSGTEKNGFTGRVLTHPPLKK